MTTEKGTLKRDPEKQRKLKLIASGLGFVFFTALVALSLWLCVQFLEDFGLLAMNMSQGIDDATNLTFPLNETRTNWEVAAFAAIAPAIYIGLAVAVIIMIWTFMWSVKMGEYFYRAYTRRPYYEDLMKYLEELYVQAEKKGRK